MMKRRAEQEEHFVPKLFVRQAFASSGWYPIRAGLGVCLLLFVTGTAVAQLPGGSDSESPELPRPPVEGTGDSPDSDAGEADVAPQLDRIPASDGASANAKVDARHRGKLGVQVADRNGRVTVHSVMSGGAAAQAGLKQGDEIVSVNGQRITTADELRSSLRLAADQDGAATIIASRDGEIQTIKADVSVVMLPNLPALPTPDRRKLRRPTVTAIIQNRHDVIPRCFALP